MSRATWAPPLMATGYHPVCSSKPGNYPCYPIMPRFGLLGLGSSARSGRGADGPVYVGGSDPGAPCLGGRTFGRGFRFPSTNGPFFADGSSAGGWSQWSPASPSDQYSYPFYSYPVLPDNGGLMGFGAMRPSPAVNPLVPRYGMSGLTFDGTGLLGTGVFSGDISTWGIPEIVAGAAGVYALYAMFYQAKQTKYRAEGALQRSRKKRAAKYRARAKKLEEKPLGFFG